MFWYITIKEIKEKLEEINEIKNALIFQKYQIKNQIKNLDIENQIRTKIQDNKLKKIEKIQKRMKKKK